MKPLNQKVMKSAAYSMLIVFILLLVASTEATAKNKSDKCKLLVSKGFTITEIDGKRKVVKNGKTVTLSAGKHKITYDHSFERILMDMPSYIKKYGEEIEFEFEQGKTYKLDVSAEIVDPGLRQPGPPQITEIDEPDTAKK